MTRALTFFALTAVAWWQDATATNTAYSFDENTAQSCCQSCTQSASYCLDYEKEQWFFLSNGEWVEETNYKNAWNKWETTVCRQTPTGWYRSLVSPYICRAVKCSTTVCPPGQFESVSCSTTTNKVCSTCGTCGVGQETVTACGGTSNIVCQSCPAGKYRDQYVVNTQTACATCLTCSTTRRERRVGCSASVNEVCPQCDAGSIVVLGATTDSCQACTAGKYAKASNNACVACTECTRTQKRRSDCSASADRVCEPCDVYKYNRDINSGTCTGCIEGYFDAGGGSCSVCAGSSCGNGNYRTCSFDVTYGGKQECKPCEGQSENQNCNPGYGVSTRCNGQGTTMVSCELCGIGKHRPAGTTLANYYQACMPCETGFFKTSVGSATCGACSNKPASNAQYVTWGSLLPSSNTCPW
jgi:hypothetical protein